MDLSTLDTLLKSHVSQLEKLYTQLGAPADSVPTKLQELHNALVGTVQRQREAAENEVKLVEDSIQALEATIARKRFQLSGDIADKDPTAIRASTTANVTSETLLQKQERLEKEDVALERDVQLREKQIVHVLNQLEEYRPVLGDFLDLDEKGSLVARTEDLSLARLQALEAKVTRCKEEIIRREEVFQSLLREILDLWNELGISPSEEASNSSSTADELLSADKAFDVSILRTTQKLAAPDLEMIRKAGSTILLPDLETLERLNSRKASLEDERERRMQKIQELYDQLFPLWTRLGVSDEEADDFVEVWKGCELRCIQAYEAELVRMLQVKADNMAIFIHREREDIIALWDTLYYSDAQRASFSLMESEAYNEEVLLAHEIEKQKLLDEKYSKAFILSKLAKYFGLLDEMRQLEESANDPSRLTGRGQRGDPGRLLREEKQRKRVAKEKPKLEGDLMKLIPEWESQFGQAFMVNGSRLLEDLSAKVESEQAARPPSRRARTPAPSAGSSKQPGPQSQSVKRTMQLQPSNSIKSCAGTTTAKKQRLGCSTASASTSGPHAVSRATLQSNILATPCPAPSTALQPGRGDMMLISSESRPALPIQSHQRAGTSRLPLKATLSSHTASYPTVWHAVGTGVAKQTLAKPSLFSPPDPIMASQHHSKAAFRPRPSIASTGTSYSSVPASSVFSGRSSRIASVATTASFGSDDAC